MAEGRRKGRRRQRRTMPPQTTSAADVTDADTTVANLPGDIGPAQSQQHHPQQHETDHAMTPAVVVEQQEMNQGVEATENAE